MLIYLYYALAIVAVIIGVAIFAVIRDFRAGSTAPRSSCSSSTDWRNSWRNSWCNCRSGCSNCSGCGGGGGGGCGGCGGGGGE